MTLPAAVPAALPRLTKAGEPSTVPTLPPEALRRASPLTQAPSEPPHTSAHTALGDTLPPHLQPPPSFPFCIQLPHGLEGSPCRKPADSSPSPWHCTPSTPQQSPPSVIEESALCLSLPGASRIRGLCLFTPVRQRDPQLIEAGPSLLQIPSLAA